MVSYMSGNGRRIGDFGRDSSGMEIQSPLWVPVRDIASRRGEIGSVLGLLSGKLWNPASRQEKGLPAPDWR